MSQKFMGPRPEDHLREILGDIIEKKVDGPAGDTIKVIRDTKKTLERMIVR